MKIEVHCFYEAGEDIGRVFTIFHDLCYIERSCIVFEMQEKADSGIRTQPDPVIPPPVIQSPQRAEKKIPSQATAPQKSCLNCGKPFSGYGNHCSKKCGQKTWYDRNHPPKPIENKKPESVKHGNENVNTEKHRTAEQDRKQNEILKQIQKEIPIKRTPPVLERDIV
jgi:hypothetical protein